MYYFIIAIICLYFTYISFLLIRYRMSNNSKLPFRALIAFHYIASFSIFLTGFPYFYLDQIICVINLLAYLVCTTNGVNKEMKVKLNKDFVALFSMSPNFENLNLNIYESFCEKIEVIIGIVPFSKRATPSPPTLEIPFLVALKEKGAIGRLGTN